MKSALQKFITFLIAVSFTLSMAPLTQANTSLSSYKVPCDNIMEVLEAGQLEEHILSVDRTEAELVQILKDNFVLLNPLFTKAFSLVVLPKVLNPDTKTNGIKEKKILINRILKLLSKPVSDKEVESLLNTIKDLSAQASSKDAANRVLHLIVTRTVEAIQKNKINKHAIYGIYKKAIQQTLILYGLALATDAASLFERTLSRLDTDWEGFSSKLVRGLIEMTAFYSAGAAVVGFIFAYFLNFENEYLNWVPYVVFQSGAIYKTVQLASLPELSNPTKQIRAIGAQKFNPKLSYTLLFSSTKEFSNIMSQGFENSLLGISDLKRKLDLPNTTLTQAAYLGHEDMIDLNNRYTDLNDLFSNSPLHEGLTRIRIIAQEVLSYAGASGSPDAYKSQMELAVAVRKSVQLIQSSLQNQESKLQALLADLESLNHSLEPLRQSLYSNHQTLEEQDITKGYIILSRFGSDLKKLTDQSANILKVQNKINQIKLLGKELSELAKKLPTTHLGWEEVAQDLIKKMDQILLEKVEN